MKNLGESNCIIMELTGMEISSYFEKFGENYWNDTEGMVCYPLKEIRENEHLKKKFENFFNIDVDKAEYLIFNT